MKIWRVRSFDHRVLDESDESARCEMFMSSRGSAMKWIRELVRERLAIEETREPDLFEPHAVDTETPVEIRIECLELAQITTLPLVLACLNRAGWYRRVISQETLFLNKHGREVKLAKKVA